MQSGSSPHEWRQLQLELGCDLGRVWDAPWGGLSLRGLTKAAIMFSLRAPPPRGLPAGSKGCSIDEDVQLLLLDVFSIRKGLQRCRIDVDAE